MASSTLKGFSTARKTPVPQSKKAAPEQKRNNAGGFTFTISDMDRAKRFLILGSEDSFYKSGEKLTAQNAKVIKRLVEADRGRDLFDLIAEISESGRAPKQSPGLFALAYGIASATDGDTKNYGYSILPRVARTASTLFEFVSYLTQFQRLGMGARKAIARWYTERGTPALGYQIVKYREREGWKHADLIKLTHPERSKTDRGFSNLLDYVLGRDVERRNLPDVVQGFEIARGQENDLKSLVQTIRRYHLTWEMVPQGALGDAKVWEELMNRMPLGALIRQLPKLTRVGALAPLSEGLLEVTKRLSDADELREARIHPLSILIALKTYASGHSVRGDGVWTPLPQIVDALDRAFYASFGTVEPAGKRTYIGLDVSGSMSFGKVAGVVGLSAREATAAMALVTVASEPQTHVAAFTGTMVPLDISPRMRLDEVVRKTSNLPFGNTDCSLPMIDALKRGLKVDTFIILTDNETWVGHIHPFEALKKYREATGIPAKLIVMSTEATRFSIATSSDAGMLDIPGFDSAAPQIVSAFSKGL